MLIPWLYTYITFQTFAGAILNSPDINQYVCWFCLQELFKQYCSKEIKTVMDLHTYNETDVFILVNKIKDTFDQLIICHKNKVNIFSLLFIYYIIYLYLIMFYRVIHQVCSPPLFCNNAIIQNLIF